MTAQEGNGGANEKRQVKDTVVYICSWIYKPRSLMKMMWIRKYIRYPYRTSEYEWNEPLNIEGKCPSCGEEARFVVLGEDENGMEYAKCDECDGIMSVDEIIRASMR